MTRPVADLRVGILKISEKWQQLLGTDKSAHLTDDDLAPMFGIQSEQDNLLINSAAIPTPALADAIRQLNLQEAVTYEGTLVAARIDQNHMASLEEEHDVDSIAGYELEEDSVAFFRHITDFLVHNSHQICADLELIQKSGRSSIPLDPSCRVYGSHEVFVEEGAEILGCHIDARHGPVYIGRHAQILVGANLQGPLAILPHASVSMGANLYSGTTIGRKARAGGEIKNAILGDYSNKVHSGYLGDSIIGNWCNLGADTTTSNMKNTLGNINIWDYASEAYRDSGLDKCGTLMGDYVFTGIHTSLTTGASIGPCTNLICEGISPKHVRPFSWITPHGHQKYSLPKALDKISALKKKKNMHLTESEKTILSQMYQRTDAS